MQKLTDNELMIMYRDGDYSAFEVLYVRHRCSLMRYLQRQTSPRAVTEELFQDIWLKLIASRERYQNSAEFRTFLFHIAHNRLIDHYRQQSRTRIVSSSPYPEKAIDDQQYSDDNRTSRDNPERKVTVQRQMQTLLALVKTLPEDQRNSYLLREEGNLSVEDIARITKTSVETAKSRIRYAITKLRKGMEAVYGQI